MRKHTISRIALVLCLALLLQLAAGPIGSLIPAASAAEATYPRVEKQILYSEDFDDTEAATLKVGETVGDWHLFGGTSPQSVDVQIKDGAMHLKGYGNAHVQLDVEGASDWSNYTVEVDLTYNSLSGWIGVAYNSTSDQTHQKGGVCYASTYYLNGRLDGGWVNDGGANNTSNAEKVQNAAGKTVRVKIETFSMGFKDDNGNRLPGSARLSINYYDDNDQLTDWVVLGEVHNIHADTYKGSVGFALATMSPGVDVVVDNMEVYKSTKILYEENFDAYDGDTAVADALTAEGSDWGNVSGKATAKLDDQKMTISTTGSSYFDLTIDGSDEWSNYTVEADLTYLTAASNYIGLAYNAIHIDNHQRAGVSSTWTYFANGRAECTHADSSGWVNNTSLNKGNNFDITNRIGEKFRLRIESYNQTGTANGSARFSISYYDEDGNLGKWIELCDVDTIDMHNNKGSIGFYGKNTLVEVDNILVYETKLEPKFDNGIAEVSDIYLADTGIANPPVVVQNITTALPDTTRALPAIAMMQIDADLNILDKDGDVISTVADYMLTYKSSVIPAFIVDGEAETEALATYLYTNDIIDVYVIGQDDGFSTSVVPNGEANHIYTATCEGVELVLTAHDISRDIRGGLLLDVELLSQDLNQDGVAGSSADWAVLCNMINNDNAVTQLIFNGELTVDQMTYFNTHGVAAWGYAEDAAGVYSAIAAGYHAVVAESAATVYDVYEGVDVFTVSGRPIPVSHRGSHMNYGTESETVIGEDGKEFVYTGKTENSVQAVVAAWNYFGLLGSEIDLYLSAACSGDDTTCSHTVLEGADACDHVSCELCQPDIVLEHDKNLTTTTNIAALRDDAKYADIFSKGNAAESYTLYELKLLSLTGKGNNDVDAADGEKLATLAEVLAAVEDLADGNYVLTCHTKNVATEALFNELLTEHPEYADNCLIFVPALSVRDSYNSNTLTVPVPIAFGQNNTLVYGIYDSGLTDAEALAESIRTLNRFNAHTLYYSYYDFSERGDDSFYYKIAARGVLSYHSITTSQELLDQYHLIQGAEGCLIEQPNLVEDWHYYVDTADADTEMKAGVDVLDLTQKVRTIVGDKHDSKNIADAVCGFTQLSGPKLTWSEELQGYTAADGGEAVVVYYYDRTTDGGTAYRVYSAPVTIEISANVTGISLNKTEATILASDTLSLFAVIEPLGATNKNVSWTSSDVTVATVSNGVVTPVKAGTVTITATTEDGGKTASCTVTIVDTDEDIEAVEAIIEALPDEIDADDGKAIADARAAYETLTADQKPLVDNYAELLAAEAAYVDVLEELESDAAEALAAAQSDYADKKAQAEQTAKDAEDAAKAAEEAEVAAEEAQADANATAQEKETAVKNAEEARKVADEKAAEAAEAKSVADEAAEVLAAAQSEAAAAKTASELAAAKYEAIVELTEKADELNSGDLTSAQIKAVAEIRTAAEQAVTAAATVEEVEKTLSDAIAEMEAAAEVDSSARFEDVVEGAWYVDYVDYMVAKGYMSGVTESVFGVSAKLTRGQIVTILYRIVGEPSVEGLKNPFTDVAEGKFYTDAVIWAYNTGVVAGTSQTAFSPNREVTREQLAAMLYRWSGAQAPESDALADFPDVQSVSAYAVDAMNWAVANGLISGIADSGQAYLAPAGTATRAQAASILARYLND